MSSASSTIPVGFAPGLALRAEVGADDAEAGRRIEDWIVSNLDDRPAKAGEADWRDTIGQLAPARRRNLIRDLPPGPGDWTRFRVARRRGITVVAILDASLVKGHDLAELADDLVALTEAGHHRLVVDFANVERLSIRAVVALAETVRGESGRGGTLKFSGFRPELAPIVAMVGLASRVEVCPDAAAAIAGPWPESPGLRPLPVPVLARLLRSDRHEVPPPPPDAEEPPMPDVRLIAHSGPFEGRAVAVGVRRFVIGRASGCQLRLGFSTVSRHHAAIERRGGAVVLLDLGSTNGTIHNGEPLRDESAHLSDGDLVRIGPLTFTLAIGATPDRAEEADDSLVEAALAGPSGHASPEDTAFATEGFAFHADLSDDGLLQVEVVEGVVVVAPRRADLRRRADDRQPPRIARLAPRSPPLAPGRGRSGPRRPRLRPGHRSPAGPPSPARPRRRGAPGLPGESPGLGPPGGGPARHARRVPPDGRRRRPRRVAPPGHGCSGLSFALRPENALAVTPSIVKLQEVKPLSGRVALPAPARPGDIRWTSSIRAEGAWA